MFKFLEKLVDYIFNVSADQLIGLFIFTWGCLIVAGITVFQCLKLFV